MPIDPHALLACKIPETRMHMTSRDTMLYALGIGFGSDPTDPDELRFVHERALVACPSMATILAAPHAWIRKAGVGFSGKSVHAGIRFDLHRPLPVEGHFRSVNTVGNIVDKGPGRHLLVETRRQGFIDGIDEPLFDISSTGMLLGEGGIMPGSDGGAPRPEAFPQRTADRLAQARTLPQQALIYRLSGDMNPLHADPDTARRAGFARPILHGLCTFGIACRLLVQLLCPDCPGRLVSMAARFSKPVFPGDLLQLRLWQGDAGFQFRCVLPERGDAIALDAGTAHLTLP